MNNTECCKCDLNLNYGDIAPENYICRQCLDKGVRVCQYDNKIFNINKIDINYMKL